MWILSNLAFVLFSTFEVCATLKEGQGPSGLLVLTVGGKMNGEGLTRFLRSAVSHGVDPILEISNDDLSRFEYIAVLRKTLEKHKNNQGLLVMIVNPDFTIINADEKQIIEKFHHSFDDNYVVFAAESSCQVENSLCSKFPILETGKRFLNPSILIGYADIVYQLLNADIDGETARDFFTNVYLDNYHRDKLKITLDSTTRMLQIIDRSDEISLEFDDNGNAYLHDVMHNTYPLIISGEANHANHLNYFGNYIGRAWSSINGCNDCCADEMSSQLNQENFANWPSITIGLFIAKPIPFVKEFLETIRFMFYPKNKIELYIYNNQIYNADDIENFIKSARLEYGSIESDNIETDIGEREARITAINLAIRSGSEFVFLIDGDVHFTNADSFKKLINTAIYRQLNILAPMVGIPHRMFTNYWGALGENGYYSRSPDYFEIVHGKRTGIWNVPFISSALLITKKIMPDVRDGFLFNIAVDPDISFCQFAREKGIFLHVDNQEYYGFLADAEGFDNVKKLHPEMFHIFQNRHLWEKRYIHEKYIDILENIENVEEQCPDVFVYPLLSEQFSHEIIEEMEHYGKWSSGNNQDERLAGGYENVPTIDIHMKQIDFENHWLFFLDEYVRPVQEKIFIGYYQRPVYANMMFVVRYKPEEQPSLRAHHDASTFTVDISLNKRDRDYEGGGIFYVRYNCTVLADKIGYAAMFPGRLTHLHEGLPTVKGTRYIAVSFINP